MLALADVTVNSFKKLLHLSFKRFVLCFLAVLGGRRSALRRGDYQEPVLGQVLDALH